jgi:hypothetical protein
MDVMHVHIDELVLEGFPRNAAELPTNISTQLLYALREHGVAAEYTREMAHAVGEAVARSVSP